ncbi:hypothetical protein FHS95_003548 [Sphingomonas naasensis]|uniref:DUF3617 domain-containing protein n=1 Tax=Sphingomonas naasensis TaxID=1344951 RepID=UPI00141BC666|nr:DUF3617 family protein [Sphingomonas naasensis]NIJ21837.1 hypothetical protein [Sphingomonas naasensis]
MNSIRFPAAPLAPLLLTLLIVGCSKGDAPANGASAEEAAAVAGIGSKLEPGLYEIVQTGDVDITIKQCLSAEQLAKSRLVGEDDLQKGWHFVRNSMSGGRFEVEAVGPSDARMVETGTYGQTAYQGESSMTYDNGGEKQAINIRYKARRIAAGCTEADEKDES